MRIEKKIEKLQYIASTAEEAEAACLAGVKWIQLRMKSKSYEECVHEAEKFRRVCTQHQVTCIINDYAAIAMKVKADGVHLGKEDMPVKEARKLMDESMIVGGTANTVEDIEYLISQRVDYIGLGPFRYTSTKKNLSPVLGLDGYKKIIHGIKEHNTLPPVISIGGITLNDVEEIMSLGFYGVAISSFITQSENKKEVVKALHHKLDQSYEGFIGNSR